ncbi:MAG: hypothetical protein H8E70_08915 [Candidatus Marinimicrobia bacterium]|nr:hypothetical protein [Candidatus Neomarinimicrobiota bacterium]
MNEKVKSEVREKVAVIHSTLHSFIISNNAHPPNLSKVFPNRVQWLVMGTETFERLFESIPNN